MWYPNNTVFTTENFSSQNTGDYGYTNYSGQNNLGGFVSLRNIATGSKVIVPAGQPWPAISWDETYNLGYNWSANSGSFTLTGGTLSQNLVAGSAILTGRTALIKSVNIAHENGYLIEFSAKINRLTGTLTNVYNGYGVSVQDTADQDSDLYNIVSNPVPGLYVNYGGTSAFLPVPELVNELVSFRCGRKNDIIQAICSNGQSVIISGATTYVFAGGPDTSGWYNIGFLGHSQAGTHEDLSNIEFGHFNSKSPVYDIAGDFIADTLYYTGSYTFTTSEYRPYLPISKFTAAYVGLAGITGGGTTTVRAFYNTGSGFISGASATYSTNTNTGISLIDLSAIPVNGDSTDKIRFDIVQSSSNGEKPSLAVEYITLCYELNNKSNLLYLYPEYGSSDGQYAITLSIDPLSKDHIRPPVVTDDTVFYTPLTGSTFIDLVNIRTGTSSVNGNSGNNFNITGFFKDNPKTFHALTYVNTELTGIFQSGGYNYQPVLNIDYSVLVSGSHQFIATKNFEYYYPTGFLGVATSTGGYSLLPYYNKTFSLSDQLLYSVDEITFSDYNGLGQSWYLSQNVYGNPGYGFRTPTISTGFLSGATYVVVDAIVQSDSLDIVSSVVATGGTYGSSYCVVPAEKVGTKQRIKNVYPVDKAGDFEVRFYSTGNSTDVGNWSVSDVRVAKGYFLSAGVAVACASTDPINKIFQTNAPALGTTYTGFIMDAWVYPEGNYAHVNSNDATDNIIIKASCLDVSESFTSYYKIALNNDLTPVFTTLILPLVDGGTYNNALTANNRLEPNKWNHVSAGIRTISTSGTISCELFITVNGEVSNAAKVTNNYVTFGLMDNNNYTNATVLVGSNFIGAIEHPRIRVNPNIYSIAPFDSFQAPPKFVSEYQYQSGSAIALYRFDKGNLLDYSSGRNYLYVPYTGNNEHSVERDSEGVFGEAIGLTNKGHLRSVYSLDYTGANATISTYLAVNTDSSASCGVFDIGATSLKVVTGYLHYTYSGTTFTGSNLLTGFYLAPVTIHHHYVPGAGTYITGHYSTHTCFTGLVAGTSYPRFLSPINFGHNPNNISDYGDVYLDEFAILTGFYSGYSFATYDSFKGQPSETVYFNNTAIATGSVNHKGVYDKQVIIPPRTNFSSSGVFNKIKVNTLYGLLDVNQVFTYIGARAVVLDAQSSATVSDIATKLCKTKSPFRIGNEVPQDAVNLAFISSQPVSVESNLALIDYANNIPENVINSIKSYYMLSGLTSVQATGNTYSLSRVGDINASDVAITSYALARSDIHTVQAPLFYTDKLGPANVYLSIDGSDNTATGSLELVRSSIKLTDQEGTNISLEDYPWDIRVSKYRKDNIVLPTGVFYVEMLTRDQFIDGMSVFANFNAVNSLNNYGKIIGYSHLMNPVPIYRQLNGSSFSTGETFKVTNLASFYDIDTNSASMYKLDVNLRSGEWHPGLHKRYNNTVEFLDG